MAKSIINLKKELQDLRVSVNLFQRIDCTPVEQKEFAKTKKQGLPLPDGVYQYGTLENDPNALFYKGYKPELTPEERKEYLELLQVSKLVKIEKYTNFFYGLAIFWLVCTIFGVFYLLVNLL